MVSNLNKTKSKNSTIPITELERSAFCQEETELESKPLFEEKKSKVRWQKIPIEYMRLTPDELDTRIAHSKNILKEKLIILGHHYQRDQIIKYTDFQGDSFKLAQYAASLSKKEYIIFCGVHFMAETADILSEEHQKVILPNLTAGCSMADMAITEDVLDCWEDLNDILDHNKITPITYMNSTAAIKAICGENQGLVCTSSNANKAMQWAFSKREKILFIPDQHLGINTGKALGMKPDDMIIWDPFKELGGNTINSIEKAKLILWKGHCSVHTRFNYDQIKNAREKFKNINIIVHPECTAEVVEHADFVGSTEYIIKTINEGKPGSVWGVGTEINLVNRIAKQHPDKTIFCLDSLVCPCSTMYRIHPAYLCWFLESIEKGNIINQIKVDKNIIHNSKIALNRMLKLN